MMNLQTNPRLELAFDYVSNTNRNIFLTGKAGTGKTTFLHQVKNGTVKRMVIVAPTGVAAINAGGMTIHSFFQLPFGPYVPGSPSDASRQRRFAREKVRLIQSLDLVVIDEISMVRADLLDGIDEVLRRYKDRNRPFGGVQLLMIGDLHQLPPVVRDEDWELLRPHYQSPYFFSSHALQKTEPVAIELTHIYRQADQDFIDLLNKVRDNRIDDAVLATLNSRFSADFQPPEEDAYITLTVHNATAHAINAQKLASIPEAALEFKAVVTGDFPVQAYPTEAALEFKHEAQVMFVKNDISREKRFYNGKIGTITRIDDGTIYVKCPGESAEIEVLPAEWTNVKYTLDEKSKEVTEETLGTFTQYPLKLAWAITIHKSQGLTFERAIIDAQAAFAHGQVYVALSRCKSFEGIVLRSRIGPSSVRTDSTVKHYTEAASRNAPDEAHLRQSKRDFQQALVEELCGFGALKRYFEQARRTFLEHGNSLLPEACRQFEAVHAQAEAEVFAVAEKFGQQVRGYLEPAGLPEENGPLQERLRKAGAYFAEKLGAGLLPAVRSIQVVTDNQAVKKTATEALESLQKECFIKNACFAGACQGFSTHGYLRTRANAELDFQAAQKHGAPAGGHAAAPRNTPHPELYVRLKKWREDAAESHRVEPYAVVPTKSLLELVHALPADLASLKRIKGIGAARIKQFGADIVDIIQDYCTAHHIETTPLPLPPVKPDTKTVSLELFKSGKTIDEIALERSLTRGTVEGHLGHFIGQGELDIFDLMDRGAVQSIEEFFSEHKTRSSYEAKAHFGEQFSYGEIRMVLMHMEGRLSS
jgi:hypothetical protein